jgi:DtxR family Mn-dependent transcriptional regulator
MLKRLEGEGLIERGTRKEALLTESGRERAEHVVRRHRIIERLLTDFMGYTGAEAHVYADELGDTFSDDMVDRMFERLGRPERCPHGWPVDPDVEQAENQELEPLANLAAGSRATIVRLAEHDGDLLHWFYDQGLVPGSEIEVEATHPEAGQVTVRLNGGDRAVSEKAAAGLFVRPV